MKTVYLSILFLALVCFITVQSGSPCPQPKSIYPCICTQNDGSTKVECDSANTDELKNAMEALSSKTVDSLTIASEAIEELPFGFFKSVWMKHLWLLTPRLHSMSHFVFLGQKYSLSHVEIASSMLRSVPIGSLNHLHNLKVFEMHWTPNLNEIPDYLFKSLPNPSLVEEVRIRNGNLTYIGQCAFKDLKNLKVLDLGNNMIRKLDAKWFSNVDSEFHEDYKNLAHLQSLVLSNNKIEEIPPYFIHIFGKNTHINIQGNRLTTLPSMVFSRVYDYSLTLKIEGNPIVCDCRMVYLGKLNKNRSSDREFNLFGYCNGPESNYGLKLIKVTPSNFESCFYLRRTSLIRSRSSIKSYIKS